MAGMTKQLQDVAHNTPKPQHETSLSLMAYFILSGAERFSECYYVIFHTKYLKREGGSFFSVEREYFYRFVDFVEKFESRIGTTQGRCEILRFSWNVCFEEFTRRRKYFLENFRDEDPPESLFCIGKNNVSGT